MKKYAPILLQAVIWTSIWAVFVFTGDDDRKPPGFAEMSALRLLIDAAFFNTAYYLLLPLYFSKNRKRLFLAASLAAMTAFVFAKMSTERAYWDSVHRQQAAAGQPVKKKNPGPGVPIYLGLMLFGAAAAARGYSAFEKNRRKAEEADRRRLEAELALLKSQINPHFLLNTLNNLYGIALTEPEKTPDALLKLSDMVRYILYECTQPTVPLSRDLDFVKNYVALQRLRLPPNAQLSVEMPDSPPDSPIEPMVLIPFIENAFKHGLTTKQPCEIFISIKTGASRLALRVENEVFPQKTDGAGDLPGIGLANTRQRLEQSYPGRHSLKISDEGGRHLVELELNL